MAGLGVLLEITGGPRFQAFGLSLSLRGGTRLLLIALVLAAIRHLIVRRDPLHDRLVRHARQIPRGSFLRHVLPAFVVSRVSVLFVAYVAALLISFPASSNPAVASGVDDLSALMMRWDALWYGDIATTGYHAAPTTANGEHNIAFFPAYPLLIRLVAYLAGGRLMLAGLMVSLAAFLGGMTYLFAFARQRLGEERAGVTVLLLASYPFSVYYSAVYTESLFLLATVGSLYHLSRRQLTRSALWALVVGLTRPNGCLLSLVLVAFAFQDTAAALVSERWRWMWIGSGMEAEREEARSDPFDHHASGRNVMNRLLVAFMPVMGMLLFSAYVYHLTGNPLLWVSAQTAWKRHFDLLAGLTSGPFRNLLEYGVLSSLHDMPLETLNSLATAFAVAAVWPVWRRFGLALALFVVLNLAAPLMSGGVVAMGRYTAILFPIFLWLGAAVAAGRRTLWICAFASGQALVAMLFFTWRAIY